ncbi:hypothetical protein ACFPAF_18685 [Hymenobacter endophyticus]
MYKQDEKFGQMRWISTDRKGGGYFECRSRFQPTGHMLDIAVDAPADGPTVAQRNFYKDIETNYSWLVGVMQPLIEAEFRNWQPGFAIQDFSAELWPVGLDIPQLIDNKPVKWELSFETAHDLNHMVTVLYQNFQPYAVRVDG